MMKFPSRAVPKVVILTTWTLPGLLFQRGDLQWARWVWVTHISVGNVTIIGSDNGLSPGWRQAIIWTNAGILLIEPSWTYFSEIPIEDHTFSLKKIHLKMSAKWLAFCLCLNVLIHLRHKNYIHGSQMYKALLWLGTDWFYPYFSWLFQFVITSCSFPNVRETAYRKRVK